MLRTRGLTKRFDGLTAVDTLDFDLRSDELCSLIGPNGAGKTTFFNLLTGALEPTAGTIEFRDDTEWHDITRDSPDETARRGLHRSFQLTNVFPSNTVLENVRIAAQAHGTNSWRGWRNVNTFEEHTTEAWTILERVDLADDAQQPATSLSHGALRQLEVAIALAGDPDILLLDEPTAGVASDGIDLIIDLIADVAEDHAVLLVEHNMDVVMHVSDRIVVLNQGSIIADDDPTAIRENDAVQKAYLGGYGEDTTGPMTGA